MKVDVVFLQAGLLCCCFKSHCRNFWESEQWPVKCIIWWFREQSYWESTKEVPNLCWDKWRTSLKTHLFVYYWPLAYHWHSWKLGTWNSITKIFLRSRHNPYLNWTICVISQELLGNCWHTRCLNAASEFQPFQKASVFCNSWCIYIQLENTLVRTLSVLWSAFRNLHEVCCNYICT